MLYKSREPVIELFNDYSSIISEAKYRTKHGESLKILTLRLNKGQVKAGTTSDNLLNETRQIIYSLYKAKEITKKVYNSIMNSIKV